MRILDTLLQAIAPHVCVGCGEEGLLVCEECSLFLGEVPSRCYKCLRHSSDSKTCQKCRAASKLSYVWVATEYEGIAESIVQSLKFGRARFAHSFMADEMLKKLPFLASHTVCYVPTSPARVRTRGYDQSKLLGDQICRDRKMLRSSLLVRTGGSRQVGSNRQQRQEQAKHMFRLSDSQSIKGESFLLVDDIVTTGATLEAAAEILKKNGAKAVSAIVFAQKTVKS